MMKATIEWKTEKHLNKGMNSCTLPNKGPKKQMNKGINRWMGRKISEITIEGFLGK